MRSLKLLFPAKRANRAMLTSTIRLAFETTIERRRNRASQCRLAGVVPLNPVRLGLARIKLSNR